MGNNPFDMLGGLMKGITNLMPGDDPAVKQMNLQSKLSDLEAEKTDVYAAVGRRALAKYGDQFADEVRRIGEIDDQLEKARQELMGAEEEQRQKQAQEDEERAARTCPSCSMVNDEGVKFCVECGSKIGLVQRFCPGCGAKYDAGTRFCGECGSQLEG